MKHNDAVIRQYCRAVGKQLPLPAAQTAAGRTAGRVDRGRTGLRLAGRTDRPGWRVQAYQKKLRRRYLLAAGLIVLAVCCAALIYAQVLTDSSVAYAEEHITILPTTDLSEAGQ